MFSNTRISFRKLTIDDLLLMQRWLNQSFVHEFYDKDKENTLDEITKRYGPKIKGEQPTNCYLVLYDNQSVAYIQSYKVNDWPEFGDYVKCNDETASVDLFIGDENFMGKGFGSLMLIKFLKEKVFSGNQFTSCIIGPEPENKRAIRAYEKVGFKYQKTIKIPTSKETTYIMELKREDLLRNI